MTCSQSHSKRAGTLVEIQKSRSRTHILIHCIIWPVYATRPVNAISSIPSPTELQSRGDREDILVIHSTLM